MELQKQIGIATLFMQRAMEISETTKHDVFVEYCPHVQSVDIRIYQDGWNMARERSDQSFIINFSEWVLPEKREEEIRLATAALDKLVKGETK